MRFNDRTQFERNLARTILAGADCIPDDIERVVRRALERDLPRDAPKGYRAVREELLSPTTIPFLARFLPELLAEVTRNRLLIAPADERNEEPFYHASVDHLGLGIHDYLQHSFPPSPYKGPFLALLRCAPKVGLQLVLDLADHATQAWIARERSPQSRYGEEGRHPLPLQMTLERDSERGAETCVQEIWGNTDVWRWFRYTSVAPNPLVCALMAFERWLSDCAESGNTDMTSIYSFILQRTHSAAVLGVLASTAIKFPERCATAVLPILRCPACYFMDQGRRNADLTEASTRGVNEVFAELSGDGGWREIQRLAREKHRQADLEWLAVRLMLADFPIREALLPSVQAFPSQLPYSDQRQIGDPVAEAHLRQQCEFLVLRLDVANYEFLDLGDGQYTAQPKHIPDHLLAAQEESQAQIAQVGEVISLKLWAIAHFEGRSLDSEGQRYTPEAALTVAKHFATQAPGEAEPLYLQEERRTAIAATAALLVSHYRNLLTSQEDLRWCRELLVKVVVHEPEVSEMSEEDSLLNNEYSTYPWGVDRSAARALPCLLAEDPEDRELREVVAILTVHRVREVRSLACAALARFWPQMPTFVWGCLMMGVGLAIRFRAVRRGDSPEPVLTWINGQLRNLIDGTNDTSSDEMARLRTIPYRTVDWAVLESVVKILPARSMKLPDEWNHRLLDVYEDWLYFTITAHVEIEDRKRDDPFRPHDWTKVFFARLSLRLLALDVDDAQHRFIEPILGAWERAPEMMEGFLRAFLMEASADDVPLDSFVTLWRHIGFAILSAEVVKELRFRYERGIEGTLAVLVFGDPMTTWRTDAFEPVERCSDLITRWCETVGQVRPCFRALIRLLSGIGFRLFVSHGVAWITASLSDESASVALLQEDNTITQSLAELLAKAYRQHRDALRASGSTWRAFNAVIDRLVVVGDPAAAELQARIRARP